MRLKLEIVLDLKVDQGDSRVEILDAKIMPVPDRRKLLFATAKLTASSFRYGVLQIPASSDLAAHLKTGERLTVHFEGYRTRIALGEQANRLSGLTNMFQKLGFQSQLNVGDELAVCYDSDNANLWLTPFDASDAVVRARLLKMAGAEMDDVE